MRRPTAPIATALVTTTAIAGAAITTALLLPATGVGQTRPAAPSGPPARYDMDVGTTSGVMAGMGSIDPIALMTGRGGRGEAQHELYLRLGSQQQPADGPRADHLMPEGARLGRSVPLVTPRAAPAGEEDTIPGPQSGERPRGRLLIFWGCGARAGAGQPVIIDFERMAAGQVPPGLFSAAAPRDRSVTFANSRTYGDWPNERSRTRVSPQSSILGAHRIASNYSPEIAFSLSQDFMPALTATSSEQPGGVVQIGWNLIPEATGYYAWTMGFRGAPGGGEGGDMVWWSSSATQQFGGALWDWIAPGAVADLIRQRVVMPPTQQSCLIPAEVKQAAPDMMFGHLYAYGPEANFAFPPRPADPRAAWNPQWTARVRYRSTTSWMVGGPDMAGASGGEQGAQPQGEQRRCRRRGGLGGVLGGALGLPNC